MKYKIGRERPMRIKLLAVVLALSIHPALADPLKARIEVDDGGYRENILETLQVGQRFTDDMIPPNNEGLWIQIPGWEAGTWRKLSQTEYRSGRAPFITQAQEDMSFGEQYDANGGIWQKIALPQFSASLMQTGPCISIDYPIDLKPDGNELEETLDCTQIHIDGNKVIIGIDKFRQRTLTTLDSQNEMTLTCTNDSRPGNLSIGKCFKIRPMEVNPARTQAFYSWLRKNGRGQLVPSKP